MGTGYARLSFTEGKEYSALIYQVTTVNGDTYYQHTVGKSMPGLSNRSPGPQSAELRGLLGPGETAIGHIHTHPYGDKRNKTWSEKTYAQEGDESAMAEDDEMEYYLVNVDGELLVRRSDKNKDYPNQPDQIIATGLYGENPSTNSSFRGPLSPINDPSPIQMPTNKREIYPRPEWWREDRSQGRPPMLDSGGNVKSGSLILPGTEGGSTKTIYDLLDEL